MSGPATLSVEAILADAGLDGVMDDVAQYIKRQRWSGAHDSELSGVTVEDAALLPDVDATIIFTVCRARFADGRSRDFALPLGVRPTGDPLAERAPTFLIGVIPSDDGGRFVYDALGDPAYVHWIWRSIKERASLRTVHATLRGELRDAQALEEADAPSVRVLTAEQSNTSLEIGDHTFLKHLRRVETGPAHELEMAAALEQGGFTHVARVLATLMYERDGETATPLVIVQPYLRNSTDGWLLALTSLRDLYADAEEALAGADTDVTRVVTEQGGAFVAEADRLGRVVGEMHATLARAQPAGAGAEPMTRAHLDAWAAAMAAELDRLLQHEEPALGALRGRRDAVRSRFDELRSLQPAGQCTRIHGDLHLGQMLRVDSGWIVLDFEGEPNRTPVERRELSTPLRDVAGMLRSFDYAAAVALTDRLMPESADWEGMMSFGDEWARQNRQAFWHAYLEAVADAHLLPPPDDAVSLRRAFELQKAVYEVGYELGHRPSWVTIPLRFLMRA